MCGVNGVFAYHPTASAPSEREVLATRDQMRKRGPDGAGLWWDRERRLALGHRRLAILDLSPLGAQPMCSVSGRHVITFNGEIYNYPALRVELESAGAIFRTRADTEVLLHLYDKYGVDMVHRLRGMFAFAIWDDQTRALFLARDPYGIKPLYTADDGRCFRFASQVKALIAGGQVSQDPEPAGIVGFLLWGSIPDPFTLYRDIQALPAGHTQVVDAAGPRAPKAYATIASVIHDGLADRCSIAEAAHIVTTGVRASVTAHLLSDVEVGVFLSAGVDSGALLGLMRDAGQNRIRAITLAFDEFRGTIDDEAPLAAKVAELYGAEHVVRRVSRREFEDDLPQILEAMDQPSIDGINAWFVSKATSEYGIKVALSGVGGDELLAGYSSFRDVPRWSRWLGPTVSFPALVQRVRAICRQLRIFESRPKALGLLEFAGSYAGAYFVRRGLFMPFELDSIIAPDLLANGLSSLRNLERVRWQCLTPDPGSPVGRVAALEASWYLRHQLLRDADWAGMAHGLEIRTPLVDISLLRALASALPTFDGRFGKALLARAPSVPLPERVTTRAKSGFSVPTSRWLRGASGRGAESRSWARSVLARETGTTYGSERG